MGIGGVTLFPLIVALKNYHRVPMGHRKMLLYGVGLIIWGALVFGWLSSGLEQMRILKVDSLVEVDLKEDFISSFSVWVFVFPAVVLAIGTNLITQYLLVNDEDK
ncbi:MAG: hypothetical protein JKY01_00785 [Pseudomonadales bacterium]|nr:hypothetical protein [Pseudomonadales bacterium]